MDYAIEIVEQSGRELTDYQVKVEITDPDFFSKCTDQKFVEFYDEDKQTLLPHYTELFDTANKKAVFWVKVPSIQANGTKMIYLNINTERTEDLSNPEAVFDFWDDFNDQDISDYTVVEGGFVVEQRDTNDYYMKSTQPASTVSIAIHSTAKTNADVVFEFEVVALEDSGRPGILFNYFDNDNYLFTRISNDDDQLQIWENKGGSYTKLNYTAYTINTNTWYKLRTIWKSDKTIILQLIDDVGNVLAEIQATHTLDITENSFGARIYGLGGLDNLRIRKYTDPEPSVTVIRLGATPTYELKLKIAQALAGETTTILDTDPKIRLLSGTDIIKELSLTAKTVYKDATNNRVVVAFLFVDDSSDEYTADNLELLFTKDNTEYVAFKSNKSFTKEANKRLPLRWEIYLNYDVDVCTYEESMVTCL